MQKGGRDEARRNGREKGQMQEGNPKPFNKVRYKMAKLNYQPEEDDEKEPPLTSSDAPVTPGILISLNESYSNSDTSNPAPKMKKLKITAAPQEETNSTPSPPSVGPTTSVVNFGPFASSGSSSNRQNSDPSTNKRRIRVVGPSSPPARRLLAPHQTTYLRPRPARSTLENALDPNPNTLMGPLEPRICKTPYETVKSALTFLKSELGLTAFHPTETTPTDSTTSSLPSDALATISPDSAMSIEEVILELGEYVNSIPVTTSSDEMKELLMEFQRRLGMPEWPGFYNLMWVSAMEFLKHLGDYFLFDSIDEDDDNMAR